MSALKILVIPGSLRTGSLNARLAATAAFEFAQAGADVTRISLGDFPLPIYDGDLQTKSGVPKHAINLKRMIGAHHGVLIVTPEYNSVGAAVAQECHRLGDPGAGCPRNPRPGVSRAGLCDRGGLRKPARRDPRAGGAAADPVRLPRRR